MFYSPPFTPKGILLHILIFVVHIDTVRKVYCYMYLIGTSFVCIILFAVKISRNNKKKYWRHRIPDTDISKHHADNYLLFCWPHFKQVILLFFYKITPVIRRCFRGCRKSWVWRRHLHCSEITACALYGLIPIFCSFISQFWSGSYFEFQVPVKR